MADTLTINVPENFDLNLLTTKLRENFQARGFNVVTASMSPNSNRIVFEKGCGGVNIIFGMGQGITANLTLNGQCLYVNYSDGDWPGKIIGLAVGWILCFIPFITSLIGCYNQVNLPKKINNEISMLISMPISEMQ